MKVLTRITHTMKEAPSGKSVWPEAGRVACTNLPRDLHGLGVPGEAVGPVGGPCPGGAPPGHTGCSVNQHSLRISGAAPASQRACPSESLPGMFSCLPGKRSSHRPVVSSLRGPPGPSE